MSERTQVYTKRSAIVFIVLVGVCSLFADMNYEGGRSVAGQYLKLLGSSALAIAFAAGLGEFIGYAVRLVSGTLVDRTRKYWWFIVGGYVVQLGSLPSMAFVSGWELAIVFLFFERLGRSIRKPALEALVSFASKHTGSGFGFGLHEAMDQIGAFLGPAIFSAFLFAGPNGLELAAYRTGLLWLFVPAALAILTVVVARIRFPHPQRFELPSKTPQIAVGGFPRVYWWLLAASGLLAFGIADFPIIGLHLSKTGAFPEAAIPLLYAGAMAVDALAALVAGVLYDRFGLKVLLGLFVAQLLTAPLVFLGGFVGIAIGMAFWGISVGTQESILKASVADRVAEGRRATGFGLFDASFGAFWLLGSLAIGALYDFWGVVPAVVLMSAAQVAATIVFAFALRSDRRRAE